MIMYVRYNHQCSRCQAFYVPYDTEVPCPNCNLVEGDRFDYIPRAAASMRFNKVLGGSYRPGAWRVLSLGDHLLDLLFGLFDDYQSLARAHKTDFEVFLSDRLAQMYWGEQQYLREHLRGIARRLRYELAIS